MTTTELTKTRAAWDAIAEGYDRFVTPTNLGLGQEALLRAGVGSGTRFLDVAAGTGALSLPAARLGAHVLATDLSQPMLDRLVARAVDEGLEHVEARVMDGHELELEDDTFDVSGSQYGVMLFPDLPRALGEMARVTRPGGTVLLVVFGAPAQVEFLGFFMGAVQTVVPGFVGLQLDPPPLPFQVADPGRLRDALTGAGLQDVRIETVVKETPHESGAQLWDWVVNSNPIGRMLVADLDDDQGSEVRRVLDDMLRERAGGDGPAVLRDPNLIGIGTV